MNNNIRYRLFSAYQVFAAGVILPLGYCLWLKQLGGSHTAAMLLFSFPVLFGYVIPGIGTNITRLWEFKAGIRLGGYTLLHGLMFGGASMFLMWLCSPVIIHGTGISGFLLSVHIGAVVIGFWNWAFDIMAVESGIAIVYNRPHREGLPSSAIVTDYAPVFFGAFGACLGGQCFLVRHWRFESTGISHLAALLLFNLIGLWIPVICHGFVSYLKYGHSGLYPDSHYQKKISSIV